MDSEKESSQILNSLLFPRIFRAFRMSVQPSKLIIAFLALTVITGCGWIMDFSRPVVVSAHGDNELKIYMEQPDRLESFIESNKDSGSRKGVFSTLWYFAASKFHGAANSLLAFDLPGVAKNIADYFKAVGWAIKYHPIYCFLFGLVKLAVISFAGGSLCRISVLQFAKGEKPGLTEALRFSANKFRSLFTVPLIPIGVVFFIGLFIFILGILGNIPYIGELLIGVSMPLTLLAGAVISIFLIGLIAGFNLMYPAIAYDGANCYDAVSRSFSYVFSRPWRMFFYTTVAAVYGSFCYMFVRFFAFLLLWVSNKFLQLGIWTENSSKQVDKLTAIWSGPTFRNLLGSSVEVGHNWSELIAAFLIRLFLWIIIGLVVSFIISFYFSANTIIYAALRKKVDDTALEVIHTESEENG